MLVKEDGPMDVLASFRSLLGIFYDGQGKAQGTNVIAEAFTCVWCLSVWIGIILTVLYYFYPNELIWLALPFGLSGGAIIVNRITNG